MSANQNATPASDHFTETEVAYLNEQMLGRLATTGANGEPHVTPVGFRFNANSGTIDIGGHNFAQSKKVRDTQANPRVAFVVDDIATVDPWWVRGIEVRGTAEFFQSGGEDIRPGFDAPFLRITPRRIVAWGLDTHFFEASRRTVNE